jgi:hypothetical protein
VFFFGAMTVLRNNSNKACQFSMLHDKSRFP